MNALGLTPKALANVSPGLLQPWETNHIEIPNTESVGKRDFANTFSVTLALPEKPYLLRLSRLMRGEAPPRRSHKMNVGLCPWFGL
jgi:hypothetical protein